MHATVAEAHSTTESRTRAALPWLVRWSPLGGLVWFLAYPVGELIGTGGGTITAEVVERAETHKTGIGIMGIVVVLSPLLLGWFVGGLYVRLRAAGADAEGVLALIGGVTFMALLFVADTMVFAPLTELPNKEENVQTTFAQTIPVLEAASWNVQAGAGVAATLMIVATSLGARRTGLLRRWAFWISLALGVVSLMTIGFIGVFAWLFWIGLASIWMLARSRA
jgi:hypothetical protein